jgi:hypothetical protein
MHKPSDLIGSAEACRVLGDIDRSTLSRWVQLGKLKPAMRVGDGKRAAFLFHRRDVEKYAATMKAAS